MIDYSTLLGSGVARETVEKTKLFETTIYMTKKKASRVLQVGSAIAPHTPAWECRWAVNICYKKLETEKLIDGKIRLDE